jgi:hypothetical protein
MGTHDEAIGKCVECGLKHGDGKAMLACVYEPCWNKHAQPMMKVLMGLGCVEKHYAWHRLAGHQVRRGLERFEEMDLSHDRHARERNETH